MIKQFRNLTPVNLFFLVVVAIVLRISVLVQLPDMIEFSFLEPFARLMIVTPAESSLSPLNDVIIAAILVIIQAVLLNRVVNEYNLLGKPTFLPALLYVTCSSIFLPFLVLTPALFCNFLIIWLIKKMLSIYRQHEATSEMFDLGMIVAVGTLIYFPFIAVFPLLYLSLLIFRPFDWRDWVAGVIGFATIYFFLAVFYYWNDSLPKFYQIWLPLATPFPSKIRINFYDYIVLIPVILILILSAFSIRLNFFRSYVQIRKSFELLSGLFVLTIISFYLKPQVRIYHFLMAVPAGSVFMAYYFLHAKKRWIYESLYFLLAAFIIYFQFI